MTSHRSPSQCLNYLPNHSPSCSQGSASFAYLLVIIMAGVIAYLAWLLYLPKPEAPIETISREGVVKQIKSLSRLQTVMYSVDTVISSEKQGTWQALWQDKQKALFIAHGDVQAGIDLSELTKEMVDISFPEETLETDQTIDNAIISIHLPAAKVFSVYLDDIEMYDWQTGIFGIVQADPNILNDAQNLGKQKVLREACDGEILDRATESAMEQVEGLFALTGASVEIQTSQPAYAKCNTIQVETIANSV